MAAPVKLPNPAPIIAGAIMKAFREYAPILKNAAIGSLDGVLRRKSGRLASSIYARASRMRSGGKLTVGTPVLYGRFWEFGWLRGAKRYSWQRRHRRRSAAELARQIKGGAKYSRRPWLRPAVDSAMPEITRRVETELNRAMSQYSGTVAIDIKIM